MKIMKWGLLSLLTIVSAVVFSFTVKPAQAATATQEYYYFLRDGGDPYTEEDYTVREEEMPASCSGDDDVCWVKATDNGNGEPAIDGSLAAEISSALSGHSSTTNVNLKN